MLYHKSNSCRASAMYVFVFLIIYVSSLLSVATAFEVETLPHLLSFSEWSKQHRKHYADDDEFNFRRKIFDKEVEKIKLHNQLYLEGKSRYYLGLNQFSDLSDDEFKETYLMTKKIDRQDRPKDKRWRFEHISVEPGTSIDWREKGVVAPVQDQGACGSCYAFAGTGALMMCSFIVTFILYLLAN